MRRLRNCLVAIALLVALSANRSVLSGAAEGDAGPSTKESQPQPAEIAKVSGGPGVLYQVGAAKIDITPKHPVLLNGYGGRKHDLTLEVSQSIYARALAIASEGSKPAVLIAVDNLGIPAEMHRSVAAQLEAKHGIPRSRLTINASHTHSAPMLTGVANWIAAKDWTDREHAAMDKYTKELTQQLVEVADQALSKQSPCRLDWGKSAVDFAINRRGAKIVDHSLPVLRIVDQLGKVRALVTNYACHCVSAGGGLDICGDWAGFASEELEATFPSSVALSLVGCGADQNPRGTGGLAAAKSQGHMLAAAVLGLAGDSLTPIAGKLDTQFVEIELPMEPPYTKEEWKSRAERGGIVGYHARKNLARLENGEAIPESVTYPIQSWTFGDDLAAVFLAGEVVIDYAKLISEGRDASRLWVSGYTNDAPCYIPSERVLREGGYEGGDAMTYYDKPRPFKPGLEKRILDAVDRQLGDRFDKARIERTGGTRALSPHQSIASMKLPAHLKAEVVAAEPLVVDPVAIDFGHDGKLWVAEMHDYPEGIDGKFKPGGRVKFLEDTNGDGRYDRATTLVDGLPFPTGVKAWRAGVLICAAPNIIFAEDTDGDGKADVQREVLSGFSTENYQARVNSLFLGLDNWIYGAAGSFGGTLHGPDQQPVDANNRDFRFQPDTGEVEAVSGRTQQGRTRDDWGNWFGCNSGSLGFHFPLSEKYYADNRNVTPPNPAVELTKSNQLFPRGTLIQFALSGPPGVPTSTCGLGIYRDTLLGKDFANNAFICESVNQLVHRMQLKPSGSTFSGHRVATETDHEFLASTDNWFRPVQALTGPDGGLYIVDMYRYLIEHPRWLTPEARAATDLRAGDNLGRIYRIVPKSGSLREVPRLSKLTTPEVVAAIKSPNGALRDMAHLELLWRRDASAAEPLSKLVRSAGLPQVRMQALCAMDGLSVATSADVLAALDDAHPGVQRHAIRIAEKFAQDLPPITDKLISLTSNGDPQVRLQLAYSLGQINDPRVGRTLVQIARQSKTDIYLKNAVLCSLSPANIASAVEELLPAKETTEPAADPLTIELISMAATVADAKTFAQIANRLLDLERGRYAAWQLEATPALLQASASRRLPLEGENAEARKAMFSWARQVVAGDSGSDADRLAAVGLLRYSSDESDVERLIDCISPQQQLAVQCVAITALAQIDSATAINGLLAAFPRLTSTAQSALLDELLSRKRHTAELLAAIESGAIPRSVIDPPRRTALLNHPHPNVKARAQKVFGGPASADIASLQKAFASIDVAGGNAADGRQVFQKHCASCHRMDQIGHAIGPDLAALTDKSPASLLTAILDPNAAVDGRYVGYVAATDAGQLFTGIIASESVGSIVLKGQEGKEQTILRKDLAPDGLRNTGKSMMPEGLARDISPVQMQDLLKYLAQQSPGTAEQFESVKRMKELLTGVENDAEKEKRRIPQLWEIAIAAGRRNQVKEIQAIFDLTLPADGEPLRPWHAVVLGGGIVNGISQAGVCPRERLDELAASDSKVGQRWRRAIELSLALADDESIKPGIRYDALRMSAMLPFDLARPQLIKYLGSDANADLRLGAVSGLVDAPNPEAVDLLVGACRDLDPKLRTLAIQRILKTADGIKCLLNAIETGELKKEIVSDELRRKLINHDNSDVQAQATRLLGK